MPVFEPADLPITTLVGDQVTHVEPAATLAEVARRMADDGISAVCVGGDGQVMGLLTERDVVRAVATGVDVDAATAADLCVTELVWTDPGATIAEVADEMMGNWVRHVLVGGPDELVGIVSIRDVLGAYAAADDDRPGGRGGD